MANLTKTDLFREIKKRAENIRKHPTDVNGVVDYETNKIIELVDEMLLEE